MFYSTGLLKNFILFITYQWTQKAGMFHYTTLEMLAKDNYSSLLVPFLSYEIKETTDDIFKHFIFFATYKRAQ